MTLTNYNQNFAEQLKILQAYDSGQAIEGFNKITGNWIRTFKKESMPIPENFDMNWVDLFWRIKITPTIAPTEDELNEIYEAINGAIHLHANVQKANDDIDDNRIYQALFSAVDSLEDALDLLKMTKEDIESLGIDPDDNVLLSELEESQNQVKQYLDALHQAPSALEPLQPLLTEASEAS